MLRQPVGKVGRDQRQRDLDLRIAHPIAQQQAGPADEQAVGDLADEDHHELAGRDAQREHAGRDRGDREAIQDQRGGIVDETFALQHDQHASRQPQASGDCERCDCIGRRDDGAKQEAETPRQAAEVMHRDRDRGRGENHASDRQQRDRPQVQSELAPAHCDARRIDQRWQHDQQHDLRLELEPRQAGHKRKADAGHQQHHSRRDVQPSRQNCCSRKHGEQDQEDFEAMRHA
jgi:hypothetical protein